MVNVFNSPAEMKKVTAHFPRAVSVFGLFPFVNRLPNIEKVDCKIEREVYRV